MTDKLPPALLTLFTPRPPLKFLPAHDIAPGLRSTPRINGVGRFVPVLKEKAASNEETVESPLARKARIQRERAQELQKKLAQELEGWSPSKDPAVRGDPYQTLFVSRLPYDTSEDELGRLFRRFGPIQRIRVVHDREEKLRGYAFIVFERERDMRAACHEMHGQKVNGRRIAVDVERGRTMKSWRPRRLGGGLGGRHYTKPKPPQGYQDLRRRPDRGDRGDQGNRGDRGRDRFERPDRERGDFDRGRWRGDRGRDSRHDGPARDGVGAPRDRDRRGGIGFRGRPEPAAGFGGGPPAPSFVPAAAPHSFQAGPVPPPPPAAGMYSAAGRDQPRRDGDPRRDNRDGARHYRRPY